jgi:hypothetical protein
LCSRAGLLRLRGTCFPQRLALDVYSSSKPSGFGESRFPQVANISHGLNVHDAETSAAARPQIIKTPHFLAFVYLFTLFFKITSVLPPRTVLVTPTRAETTSTAPIPAQKPIQDTISSPEAVILYVRQQAFLKGVNPEIALFIVAPESQDGVNIHGDDGNSRGVWMISDIYHPEVSDQCAYDLTCSTAWSLNWILAGHISQWSTWRLRCKLYPYDDPPNCSSPAQ